MDCQELDRKELAEKYVSGQLDPALQDEFETHILECPRCLRTLEVLQNVRDDLADRAHEIRAHSSVQRVRFRWQWVAAVPVLLIAGVVGVYQLVHTPQHAPSVSQQNSQPASNSTPSAAASTLTPDAQPRLGHETIDLTKTEIHQAAAPVPSSEQAASKQPTHPAPSLSIGQAPDSSTAKSSNSPEGSRAAVNSESNKPGVANLPPGSHDTMVSSGSVKDKSGGLVTASRPASENDEVAKERFRLGIVQPPPYTFSGFASAKPPGGKGSKSGLGKALDAPGGKPGQPNSSEIARGLFQKAMDAYLEQRYSAAASLLEDAAQVEPKASDVNFFLGICRIMLAKPEDAVAPLENVLADEKSTYAQSAHYYLAKAYVQTDHLPEAEVQLQAAAAMPGRLRSEASSMLSRVQALRATQGKQEPPEQTPKHD